MSSCGNPATERDALMPRRLKFDRSKNCIKCKQVFGKLVIRHAVYCKDCFFSVVITKFRRILGSSVNPVVDNQGRRTHRASGNLLIAFSGGLGSTVLLDLASKCYFRQANPRDLTPHVGKKHPRNGNVWSKVAVCYVEICNSFPGIRDKTEEVRTIVEQYDGFEFIPLRVEDAFDISWWEKVSGRSTHLSLSIDTASEDLSLFPVTPSSSSIDSLHAYLGSLPTPTAISSAVKNLTRLLLLYTAWSTKSSHLLFGTSLTSLSINLVSSISHGGGFVIREESEEEWRPSCADLNANKNDSGVGRSMGSVRVIRPLKDIGMKECALWLWWMGLRMVGREVLPDAKHGIRERTKDFIIGLEKDYPSTVPAITRTCDKVTPKECAAGMCPLCNLPVQRGIQDWKARISIRSFDDLHSELTSSNVQGPGNILRFKSLSPLQSLAPFLCYACHTTFTSRKSPGSVPTSLGYRDKVDKNCPVILPVWLESGLLGWLGERREAGEGSHANDALDDSDIQIGNLMTEAGKRNIIAEFLLDDHKEMSTS